MSPDCNVGSRGVTYRVSTPAEIGEKRDGRCRSEASLRWDRGRPHTGQCFSGADEFILHRFNYSTKRPPDDATIMWIQSFLCPGPGHLISEIDFWLKHEYLKWLLNDGLISSLQAVQSLH